MEKRKIEQPKWRVANADRTTKRGKSDREGALKAPEGKMHSQTAEVHIAMMSLDPRVKVIKRAMDKSELN